MSEEKPVFETTSWGKYYEMMVKQAPNDGMDILYVYDSLYAATLMAVEVCGLDENGKPPAAIVVECLRQIEKNRRSRE
jgi:hypothetical protein